MTGFKRSHPSIVLPILIFMALLFFSLKGIRMDRQRYIKRDRFDFELGTLKKSPCSDCPNREHFPKCFKGCEILDGIQTFMAAGISSSQRSEDPVD